MRASMVWYRVESTMREIVRNMVYGVWYRVDGLVQYIIIRYNTTLQPLINPALMLWNRALFDAGAQSHTYLHSAAGGQYIGTAKQLHNRHMPAYRLRVYCVRPPTRWSTL